jgi:uncharacterized protein (UPF0335 family)
MSELQQTELPDNVVRAAFSAAPDEPTPMFDASETGEAATMTVAAGQLRSFIERVERLEEEKKIISEDIKEVFAEMKGTGFDTKAVRKIVSMRKQDQAQRQEAESILELYMNALGMS